MKDDVTVGYSRRAAREIAQWSLQKLLWQIGFDEIRIFPFDWLHPSTPEALISLISATGHLLEKIPAVKEFAGSLLIRGRRPVQA